MNHAPHMIVVMGVSGSGKTTVGRALANLLGVEFQEGDDLHPASNTAKMRAGIPLDDDDRTPWLQALADWIERQMAARRGGVVSCSALKQVYRDRLRLGGGTELKFVFLDEDEVVLFRRLTNRSDHFMPAALLSSQLAALERPTADERALVLSGHGGPEQQVRTIISWLDNP